MPAPKLLAALAVSCVPAFFVGCLQNHELFEEVAASAGMGAAAGTASSYGGRAGSSTTRNAVGEACDTDADCVSGSWCMQGTCTACGSATDCRDGFSLTARNGCLWCAPPNECVTDASCGDGMRCFSGSQCEPGCQDLTCCHGNLCGDPECGAPDQLDCSVIGCPDGYPCMGTSLARNCGCYHHQWSCDMSDGGNHCEQR